MTEFEKAALELLADISARLRKIEEAAEHFQGKSKRGDAAMRANAEMLRGIR